MTRSLNASCISRNTRSNIYYSVFNLMKFFFNNDLKNYFLTVVLAKRIRITLLLLNRISLTKLNILLSVFFRLEVVKNKLNRQNPISIINHEMKVSFSNNLPKFQIREKNEIFLNSLFPEYSNDEPLENQDQVGLL